MARMDELCAEMANSLNKLQAKLTAQRHAIELMTKLDDGAQVDDLINPFNFHLKMDVDGFELELPSGHGVLNLGDLLEAGANKLGDDVVALWADLAAFAAKGVEYCERAKQMAAAMPALQQPQQPQSQPPQPTTPPVPQPARAAVQQAAMSPMMPIGIVPPTQPPVVTAGKAPAMRTVPVGS